MVKKLKWLMIETVLILMGILMISTSVNVSAASNPDITVDTNANAEANVGGAVHWSFTIPKEKIQNFKKGETIARIKIDPNAVYYDQLHQMGTTNIFKLVPDSSKKEIDIQLTDNPSAFLPGLSDPFTIGVSATVKTQDKSKIEVDYPYSTEFGDKVYNSGTLKISTKDVTNHGFGLSIYGNTKSMPIPASQYTDRNCGGQDITSPEKEWQFNYTQTAMSGIVNAKLPDDAAERAEVQGNVTITITAPDDLSFDPSSTGLYQRSSDNAFTPLPIKGTTTCSTNGNKIVAVLPAADLNPNLFVTFMLKTNSIKDRPIVNAKFEYENGSLASQATFAYYNQDVVPISRFIHVNYLDTSSNPITQDINGNPISPDTDSGFDGYPYTIKPRTIPGYQYTTVTGTKVDAQIQSDGSVTGTWSEANDGSALNFIYNKKADTHIKIDYIDLNNNLLKQVSDDSGTIDKSWTKPDNIPDQQITVDGVQYNLVGLKPSDSVVPTALTATDQTVNYQYKPATKQTKVTVQYVAEDGTMLNDDAANTTGASGSDYSLPKDIPAKQITVKGKDYNLVGLKKASKVPGTYTDNDQIITYEYKLSSSQPGHPVIPGGSGSSSTTPSTNGSTTPSIPGNSTPNAPSNSSSSSSTAEPALPNYAAKKNAAVYSLNRIYLYKHANFKKSQRVAYYTKKPRIDRPMFVVAGYARSAVGKLRYEVRDVNHLSKTDGKRGYITANWGYVRPVYYAGYHSKITVINPRGVNAYKAKNLTGKVKNYKQGTVLHVKGIVKHNLTTRFILTNGKYVTANRKLVNIGRHAQPTRVKAKTAVNRYNNVNLTKSNRHYAKGHIFKVYNYDYSNGLNMTKRGTLRYRVAGGYITGNSKYVTIIK